MSNMENNNLGIFLLGKDEGENAFKDLGSTFGTEEVLDKCEDY